MVTKKRKTTKRKTRVVYVREEDNSLDRTMGTVGNLMVLGLGMGMVGGMLGGMNK